MLQEQIVEKYPSIATFSKGMNESVSEQLIGIDEAIVANNVDISDGSLKTCKGYRRAFPGNLPKGKKTLIKHYDDDKYELLVATSNSIYKYDNDNEEFTKIYSGNTSNDYEFVNYQIESNGVTILANGVDEMIVYDGEDFRPVKYNGKDSDEDEESVNGGPNRAPQGKYLTLHKHRLWTAGVEDAPNTAYHSKDLDIDKWDIGMGVNQDAWGGIAVVPTWDGGVIIGLESLFDDVVIFKSKSVFRVFGTYPGNYSVIQIFATVDGEILHKTISSLENTAIWTSTKGVHLFNGVNSENISMKVQGVFDRLNIDEAHKAVGVIHNKKYIVSLPVDGSSRNNIVIEYNMETGAFITKSDLNIDSFLEIEDKLYFTNEEGHIFEYNVGNDFDGKPIHMIWESGMNSYDEQQAMKILNRIYFKAKGKGQIKITSVTERKAVERYIDLEEDIQFYRQRLRNKGRFLKFIIENVDGSEVELREFQYMLDLDYD